MKYLLNHHILSDVQFGFRENHSAELQLINATHDYLNNRSQTGVILLDCSKAFDKVPHHLLLLKLEHYGIQGRVLSWITDFLSDHSQRVVCGSYSSEPVSVVSGVSQGSVIGPLLFLIYINDNNTTLVIFMSPLCRRLCPLQTDRFT